MYPSPISDLALKHILESGLKVVNDEPVEEGRRKSVLRALVDLFTEANKGSEAVAARNMLIAVQEPPAFERFALFFRYLNRSFGADLPVRLAEATQVFSAIEQQAALAPDARNRVAELLQSMLTAIGRESKLARLTAPKEVHLSF